MKKIIYPILLIAALGFSSCANIFNGVVMPNQCKKCELFNSYTGEKVWEVEGCGAKNTKLERQCREKAWELSRGKNLCDFDYKCKTWREEKEQ